jgi:hypothetical protein
LIICHFVFYPTDAAGDKKMSRAAGLGARWRGSGHGYYFSTAEVFWVETKNCSKMPLLLPGRAAVKNRHAGTGEVINSSALGW